jgi:hypothetical protein
MSAKKKMVRGEERISFWRGESGMARRNVRGLVLMRYLLILSGKIDNSLMAKKRRKWA